MRTRDGGSHRARRSVDRLGGVNTRYVFVVRRYVSNDPLHSAHATVAARTHR